MNCYDYARRIAGTAFVLVFFFQAEDGIRDLTVTGVQTCALPISVKHFAIVTNIWDWKLEKLIDWHRQKAGTIEAIHDVIKNELGAGVMPCGRFGANGAWLRMAVITHNVLTALKRLALPPELLSARPKRLRFLIFNTAGQVLHHARKMVLRLATTKERLAEYWAAAMKAVNPATA